jgi:DNA-damage-inducible protein D
MSTVDYGNFSRALDSKRLEAPNGQEYWMGRDLQAVLNYARWENFEELIEKARVACQSGEVDPAGQFRQTTKLITAGKGAQREISDWYLSRYACYLIAINGDPRLPEVAYAQQYFAVQTRLQEQAVERGEVYDRVTHRKRVSAGIKALNSAAKQSGVQRYGLFHDAGYKGLYGDLGLKAIKAKKGLSDNADLLDHAGRAELAANEFKNVQTEEQLKKNRVQGEQRAIDTHHRVGREVREAIKKIGGVMPEELEAEESVKKIEAARKKAALPGPRADSKKP